MILSTLMELAHTEGLLEDPDYEPLRVTHIIELSKDGKLLGLSDIRQSDSMGKPRGVVRQVPKTPGRTIGIVPQFLYDKSDYLLGFKVEKDGSFTCTDKRLEASRDLMKQAASESEDDGLFAVDAFLSSLLADADRMERFLAQLDSKELGSYWFSFRLQGDDCLISDRPVVREWWKRRRSASTEEGVHTCLITGENCVPVDKHDVIKKIPGGSTSGIALVTFNSRAFESYGLSRNKNAPVSREAAEAYTRALNRLLDPAWPKPGVLGETLPTRRVILNENTVVAFWSANPRDGFADLFQSLLDTADEDSVQRLFESPKSGVLPYLDDSTPFYLLTLSGAQGRATVRGWLTETVSEMAARMRQWFEDLELETTLKKTPRASASWLLRSIAVAGEQKNIPPNLAAEVFDSILRDRALPMTLLSAAIRRCKAEGPSGAEAIDAPRAHLRMQLIKATLLRLKRQYPESYSRIPEVKAMLDESNANKPYVLGRLFATLERLQSASQGQTNATITDRFYGAASSTPAVTFGRLLGLSRHHMSKLRREKPGLATVYDKWLGEIFEKLDDRLPTSLPLEDQALFAVGYYHQHQAFFRKKGENVSGPETTDS